jgi:hypothetical protein
VGYPAASRTAQWFYDTVGGANMGSVEKVVWHTTETTGWPGYDGGKKAPHYTVRPDFGSRRMLWRQHFPDHVNARAMRNEPGGVQTNLDGAMQVEIVGTCDETRTWAANVLRSWDLADWQVEGLAMFVAWAHRVHAVPLLAPSLWLAYGRDPRAPGRVPASYGDSPARMAGGTWDRFRGHCGHQHAPENCVTPDTPILCADLSWRPAGDLAVGDRIVAFDEEGDGVQWHVKGSGRRFRTATITRNDPATKECAVVRTDKAEVTASLDHPWLVRRPVGSRGRARFAWVATRDLEPGDLLAWFAEPWQHERTWEAGWLAGMFDADGWLSFARLDSGGGAYLGIGQRDGATQHRVVDAFRSRGFNPTIVQRATHKGWNRQPFAQVSVWGLREQLRCLGTIRPPRLLDNELSVMWEGRQVRHTVSVDAVEVREVEPVGERPIASITTSTGTFITGGFLTHNSHGDPGRLPMGQVLARAAVLLAPPTDQTEDDDMTPQEFLKILTETELPLGVANSDLLGQPDGKIKVGELLVATAGHSAATNRLLAETNDLLRELIALHKSAGP